MFSKACEYGIRAVIFIAMESKQDRRVGIKEICKATGTPESFTAKILQNLSKRSVISSAKGPTGGFYIDQDYASIKLFDIVDAIDGSNIFNRCGLGLKFCSPKKPCPIHDSFAKVRDELTHLCHNTDLEELTIKFKSGRLLTRN